MGRMVYGLMLWGFFNMFLVSAQPLITKETKILLVMQPNTEYFTSMELFNPQMNMEVLDNKYPDHRLFIGLMQGGYKLTKNSIKPENGTLVTIYTNQQPYLRGAPFPKVNLHTGSEFAIGNNMAEVVSNKKGELILRIK